MQTTECVRIVTVRADILFECIYCRHELPPSGFTREHVLSRAFGTFADAPVLHNAVCKECNQFFGDALETRVARSAFEGMLRYQRNVKIPDKGRLHLRYVDFTIPEGSDWSGVRLHLAWRDGRLVVDLPAQAAFLDSVESRWRHFTHTEIAGGVLSRSPTLETKAARLYAASSEARDGLLRLLEQQGVTVAKLDHMDPPPGMFDGSDITVEVSFTINKGIRRCMAKYSLNFLAFTYGSTFVLQKDFDVIRRFIRYGETPANPLVKETVEPILHDDSTNRRQTAGHLLTLNWAASGVDIVGQVSLFNSVTYAVALARPYTGALWVPMKNGLHFNIREKIVQPLFSPTAIHLS